jgi:hypothetical protein
VPASRIAKSKLLGELATIFSYIVALGDLVVSVLPFGPKVRGCPAEDCGFLMAIKIRSTNSFGGEVKPSVPCRKTLRHVKDPYRYEQKEPRRKSSAISRQVSSASLLGTSAGYCQRALVVESGMIRTQIRKTQEITDGRSVWDALCDTNL